MNRAVRIVLWLLAAALLPTGPVFAACATPPGNPGDQFYNTTYNVMQYCNGTNWINMGTLDGGGNGVLNGLTVNGVLYATTSSSVASTSTTANAVLITNSSGVASESQTLPNAAQLKITALGAITTGTWNGTGIGVTYGGTGDSNPSAHAVMLGEGSSAMTALAAASTGYVLTSNGSSNDPSWQAAAAGLMIGTTAISSGTNTYVLYDNSGTLGNYTITGTGNVVMSVSPTLTGTITAAAANFSGSVGIGTTSPSYTLTVNPSGTTAIAEITPQTWSGGSDYAEIIMGDTNHYIETTFGVGTTIRDSNGVTLSSGSNLSFATASNTRLTINSAGQFIWSASGATEPAFQVQTNNAYFQGSVGIGTTSPANALDVGTGGGIHIASGTPGSTANALYNVSGVLSWNGNALATAGSGGSVNGTANYIPVFTGSGASIGNSIVYQSGSSVGIGTTGPQATLHIYQTGNDTSESTDAFTVGDSTTGAMRLYAGVNNANTYSYIGSVKSGTAYEPLILQPNGSNVGVGTTSPGTTLQVVGAVSASNGSGGGYGFAGSTPNWGGVFTTGGGSHDINVVSQSSSGNVNFGNTSNQAAYATFGSNASYFNESVGIGTSSVYNSDTALTVRNTNTSNNSYLRISAPVGVQSSLALMDDANGQDIVLYRPASTQDFAIWTRTSGSNMLYVNQSTGHVNINTSSDLGYNLGVSGSAYASSSLQVGANGSMTSTQASYGTISLTGAYNGWYGINYGPGNSYEVGIFNSSGGGFYNPGLGAWTLYELQSNDHVSIGYSTDCGYILCVDGDVMNNGWFRSQGNTGWYSQTYGIGLYAPNSTYIEQWGTVDLLFNGYFESSDRRLKHDIKTFSRDGLVIVDQLRPVLFKWNKNNKDDFGVIAQEVQKILPEVVNKDDKGFLNVQYDKLVLPVIKAVQELKQLFDADHEEIENLEIANEKQAAQMAVLRDEIARLEANHPNR